MHDAEAVLDVGRPGRDHVEALSLCPWAQQPAPIWRGFHPLFAAASDMLPVDFLEVVAICMTGSGTFTRPQA